MSNGSLDPHATLAALGVHATAHCTPVFGGWDAAIWRVDVPDRGQTYALRVFSAGNVSLCEREARAMRVAATAAPVPRIHALGVWRARPAMLMDWVAGRTAAEALRAEPATARRLGVACGRAQAALHRARVPAQWRDAGWLALAGPEQTQLCERLGALELRTDALLHLDYHPLNVLVDDAVVTGVIDWSNARGGDPRADLARTCSILRLMAAGASQPSPLATATLRAFEAGWRRGYGRWQPEMPLFMAWAGAMMQRDLAPKLGQPGVWSTEQRLVSIARWTAAWKRRAGLDT
jgi:aminoglycoside phosphotransferase (APT) family kinase protein